eukprot:1856723-Pleurochrysis_carterae.AAC.1
MGRGFDGQRVRWAEVSMGRGVDGRARGVGDLGDEQLVALARDANVELACAQARMRAEGVRARLAAGGERARGGEVAREGLARFKSSAGRASYSVRPQVHSSVSSALRKCAWTWLARVRSRVCVRVFGMNARTRERAHRSPH